MAQKLPSAPTAAEIDQSTAEYFTRDQDRPGRRRAAQPAEVRKAKSRRRVAAWRVDNDRQKRPESQVLARVALDALLLSLKSLDGVSVREHAVVSRLLVDLHAAGYDLSAVKRDLKRRWQKLHAERLTPGP